MVEEDVDQLPEHVVEGPGELLANQRVLDGRLELLLGAHALEKAMLRQPRARGKSLRGPAASASVPNAIAMSSARRPARPACSAATLRAQGERGQRPLAHDHRVDELDRDVPGV